MTPERTGRPARPVSVRWFGVVVAAALAVTTALVVFGLKHTPNYSFSIFGSSGVDAFSLKSKIATGVLGLALLQLLFGLWMFRRLPGAGPAPRSIPLLHRVIGAVLFLATLPVAVHCMIAYGVQTSSARVTVHSFAGCFFYGAFVAKVLVVRSHRLPGWVLPTIGGILVTTVAVIWYSSALWFFNGYQLPIG
jgi:hypothetical protein